MRVERWLTAAILCLAVLGGLAIGSGVWSAGPLTGQVLRLAAGLHVPPLDDPAMIRRAAAHYDLVCAGCHGSPVDPNRGDHLKLMPPAPRLHHRIIGWEPEVLFLTVKHGIPDSGMPAWPAADRDDEVWSVVAFLRALPGMDGQEYRRLAGLDVAGSGPRSAATCLRCHGPDGRGDPNGAFPRLDIQTDAYLRDALQAYAAGRRQSGFMTAMAQSLQADGIKELSLYFAGGPEPVSPQPASAPDKEGALSHIPKCVACHGPPARARPQFPALTGQYPAYLHAQLTLFATDPFTRGGGPFVGLMREAGHALTPDQITALSRYFGGDQDNAAQTD